MDPNVKAAAPVATRRAYALLEEFKAFALKGNVIDLAVGVVIGAAFGKIFVEHLSPATREFDMGERRAAQHGADRYSETAHMKSIHRHARYLANGSGLS